MTAGTKMLSHPGFERSMGCPSGVGREGWKPCDFVWTSYRQLSKITMNNVYPLPSTDDTLDLNATS